MPRGRPRKELPPTPRMCILEVQSCLIEGGSINSALRKVAEKHGFEYESMKSAWRRHHTDTVVRRHGLSHLDEAHEEALVALYLAWDVLSLPLNTAKVKRAAQTVWNVNLGPEWFSRFEQRHGSLLTRRHRRQKELTEEL